jgi:hypothetical protein
MGNIRHSNNASATLAAGIIVSDTSLTVGSGEGALFPTVGAGAYAKVSLEDTLGNLEIVHLTSRAGDVLTVTRAQEGTIALAFPSGSRVENRITAAALNEFIQSSGDTFAGILDAGGVGQLSNARINGGETVLTPMRGATGVTTNQFVVPAASGPPTIGGSVVYTVANLTQAAVNAIAFPVGTVLLFHGLIGNIPAGFQACDGTNGTPDMRDKFVVGAGGAYAEDSTGGALSVTSGAGGAHTPTIQGTAVTVAQMPVHSHFVAVNVIDSQTLSSSLSIARQTTAGGDTEYNLRGASGTATVGPTGDSGSGGTHTHTADAVADHTHTVATVPPYRALFFIMKV